MINDENTAQLIEMAKLVGKYAVSGDKEAGSEASSKNRRRAWLLLKHLARFATHLEQSDFYHRLADAPNKSPKDQQRCHDMARQEERGWMEELHAFEAIHVEMKFTSDGKVVKTKNQVAHETYIAGVSEKLAAAKDLDDAIAREKKRAAKKAAAGLVAAQAAAPKKSGKKGR